MIRLISAILTIAFPYIANSQELRVQSGNHPEFARLVILSRDLPEWKIEKVDKINLIKFGRNDINFLLDSVFELIPRDRILSVFDVGNGTLSIELACACEIETVEIAAGLIIDVRDPSPQAENPIDGVNVAQQALQNDFSDGETMRSDSTLDQLLEAIQLQGSGHKKRLAEILTQESYPFKPKSELDLSLRPDGAEVNLLEPSPENIRKQTLSSMQDELRRELARSAANGLVNLTRPFPIANIENELFSPPVSDMLPTDDQLNSSDQNENMQQIYLETANDRGVARSNSITQKNRSEQICNDEKYVDIAKWGPKNNDTNKFIIPRRVSQIDNANEYENKDEKENEIVKRYIYYTFGIEALSLLRQYHMSSKERRYLTAMAEIMDSKSISDSPFKSEHIACDTRVSLWALIAQPEVKNYEDVKKEAIILAFYELPRHIRIHIAPQLIERFLSLGDNEAATRLADAIQRTSETNSININLIEAELAAIFENIDEAIQNFTSIVLQDGPHAPRAAVRLIDESINSRVKIDSETKTAIDALSSEVYGTEEGYNLYRANLRAEAHVGNIMSALSSLVRAVEREIVSDKEKKEIVQEIFDLVNASSSNAEKMSALIYADSKKLLSLLQQNSIMELSRFALQSGLPNYSRRLLEFVSPEFSEEKALATAQSFYREGKFMESRDAIMGYSSPKTLEFKIKILIKEGRYDEALKFALELDRKDILSDLLKRSSVWSEIKDIEEGPWEIIRKQNSNLNSNQEELYNSSIFDIFEENRKNIEEFLSEVPDLNNI